MSDPFEEYFSPTANPVPGMVQKIKDLEAQLAEAQKQAAETNKKLKSIVNALKDWRPVRPKHYFALYFLRKLTEESK